MNEHQICEVAAKLAQKYVEMGAYQGTIDTETAFEIAEWYMNREGIQTYGVVSESDSGMDFDIRYINRGETYACTVVLDGQEFFSSSFGDYLEQAEQDYNEENDTIRCAYCSHLTPLDQSKDWSDTICECCGHYVDGSEVENNEKNDTIRCECCSHLTPFDQPKWSDVICECCGHYVDGSKVN